MPQNFEILQKQMQKMVLSPQMQQAIYLLQIPLQELQLVIQQEMNTNPVLEETADTEDQSAQNSEDTAAEPESELNFKEEFDILAKLDDEWKDYFKQSSAYRKFTQQDEEKRRFMMDSITKGESLQNHLLKQLGLFITDTKKRHIGESIIGNIDDNGYLKIPIEELAVSNNVPAEQISEVLNIIQTFNPIGVGARDLKECLLIQMDRLGKKDKLIRKIIEEHLDLIGGHKYAEIASLLGTNKDEVKKAAEFIITLDPKPGRIFSTETAHYITPDVFVEKVDGQYVVTLNDEKIPHLYISKLYRTLMQNKGTLKETKNYIKNKVQAGKWLIKNIQQRQQTIYRIATEIVNVQHEFLDEGISFLKPLTMQNIATTVSLHESTVSRAIANKHIQTPQGIFQFKYFFSSGYQTQFGESISTRNVKGKISTMIKEEDLMHPLGDEDIAKKLSADGIQISRRTIAKYRQELGIDSSSHRRKKQVD